MSVLSIIIFFACVGGISMVIPPVPCLRPCPLDNTKICVTYVDGRTETFPNQCSLDNSICLNPRIAKIISSQSPCLEVPFHEFDPCLKLCQLDNIKICVTYADGSSQTFLNQCALESNICNNPGLAKIITSQNPCLEVPFHEFDPCLKLCKLDNIKICVRYADGRSETFANQCALDYSICKNPGLAKIITSQNPCLEFPFHEFDPCLKLCKLDYIKICVRYSDGKSETFPNQCALDYKICKDPGVAKRMSQYKCPSS